MLQHILYTLLMSQLHLGYVVILQHTLYTLLIVVKRVKQASPVWYD
jgi:hypothetical protein